ncbi:MAG TPA: hypothetical protein VG013_02940 [Gemmataceae bacterium]|jgi:hypothetical protein|nr:hypothetical protein [Gemmataceae bacterium]
MKRFLVSAAVVLLGLAVSFGCGTLQKVPLDPGLAVVALGFLISGALGVAAPTPRVPAAEPTAEDSTLATAA